MPVRLGCRDHGVFGGAHPAAVAPGSGLRYRECATLHRRAPRLSTGPARPAGLRLSAIRGTGTAGAAHENPRGCDVSSGTRPEARSPTPATNHSGARVPAPGTIAPVPESDGDSVTIAPVEPAIVSFGCTALGASGPLGDFIACAGSTGAVNAAFIATGSMSGFT